MSDSDDFADAAAGLSIMLLIIIFVIIMFTTGAVTDEGGTERALRGANLEAVQVGGIAWWDCGLALRRTRFEARNLKGETIKGAVCQWVIPPIWNRVVTFD